MRASALSRYCNFLQSVGAPAERLLEEAGIPPLVLAYPRALIAASSAYRFGELACRNLGTEHLGLHVAKGETLADIPVYGPMAAKERTVRDYLIRGSQMFRIQSSEVRFELATDGRMIQFRRRFAIKQGLGTYQSDLEAFAIIINHLRQALGTAWDPETISFAYAPEETMPQVEAFGNARILQGNADSYLEFPATVLDAAFPLDRTAGTPSYPGRPSEREEVPSRPSDLVTLQLRTLLPGTDLGIKTVAASLGLSPRSLQRHLLSEGASYRQLVAETRFDAACDWLTNPDMSVQNIAFDLGYTDPANFNRAFRSRAGMPPQKFRESLAGVAMARLSA